MDGGIGGADAGTGGVAGHSGTACTAPGDCAASGETPLCCQGTCLAGVAGVSARGLDTCASKTDGTLWCWGNNSDGQLGDGTVMDEHSPIEVTALGASVAAVSVGTFHTCARKTDGTLWCWGRNSYGQLGDGSVTDEHSPIEVTALGASVAAVSAGEVHTCARKTDGTLWCWGENSTGELGDGTTADKHSPVEVTALGASVAEVSAGAGHTCARKTDNTLWCWGLNYSGELGNGTTADEHSPVQVTALGASAAEVSASFVHTCARKTDGTLWCWGDNVCGQLGDGTNAVKPSPVEVTALGASVAEISTADCRTCARKTDGTLWCWGDNFEGQLGDGTNTSKPSPVEVTALGASVAEATASAGHTCARKTDGTLWCWGDNASGQLGDGTDVGKPSPVEVTALGCP